jgi:hypothetical protein
MPGEQKSQRSKKKMKESPLVLLQQDEVQGKPLSPHTISLRSGKVLSQETSSKSSFLPQKKGISRSETLFSLFRRKYFIHREILRMLFLGGIFFTCLGGIVSFMKVKSFTRNLEAEKENLHAEITRLQKNIEIKNLPDLLNLLQEVRDILQSEPLLLLESFGNASTAIPPSSIEGLSALRNAADLLTESAEIVLRKESELQAQIENMLKENGNLLAAIELSEGLLSTAETAPLPADLLEKIAPLHRALIKSITAIEKLQKALPAFHTLLGETHTHTFAILFQNNSELRPSGGFLGSLVIGETFQGKIRSWKFHDVYEFDGQLAVDLPPPSHLAHLTSRWFLRDANISPEFSESAENIRWFLEQEKGPTLDTVIAIDQKVLEEVLTVTGPIDMPDLNLEITSENAAFLLSYLVEAKLLGEGGPTGSSPKQILPELMNRIFSELDEKKLLALVPGIFNLGAEKHVQIYSRDTALEKVWEEVGLSGKFFPQESGGEFLGLVASNIGGNKSDAFMEENTTLQTLINLQGEVFHTLTIARSHSWGEKEEAEFEKLFSTLGSPTIGKEDLKKILGQGDNQIFTSVYLPKGTRLLSTKNLIFSEVQNEENENFTLFHFFFPKVSAGNEETIELFFASPRKINLTAGAILPMEVLAQPGRSNVLFSHEFLAESGIQIRDSVETRFIASPLKDFPLTSNYRKVYLIERSE